MSDNDPEQDATSFFSTHPEVETVEAFVVDVNGVLRGKWLPAENAAKIYKSGLRLTRSVFAVDIWGQDVVEAGLVVETGDSDGVCRPVPGSLMMVPWLERPTAQLMLSMENPDGTPFFADSRQVLRNVLSRCEKAGLTAVVATELEFYLFSKHPEREAHPMPPLSPRTGKRMDSAQVYSIGELQEFDGVLADIGRACKAQGVPADTTISENGPGQFEVNILHVPDALLAADYAIMLKRIVKGVARAHGLDATFMAKPYIGCSGNGFHTHISLLDENGVNIFAGKTAEGTDALRHAIGGLLDTMADGMAIFAANANSYRRFAPGTHAPTQIAWGYDNRSASVRVPESDLAATRIEHRVAGADANPYLVVAVVIAGMLHGLENKIDPGPPAEGDIYSTDAPSLPLRWGAALDRFEGATFIAEYLGADYRKVYTACKRQEKALFEGMVSDIEYNAYLRDV